MLGFRSQSRVEPQSQAAGNQDIAKLLFDTFSRRVSEVETGIRLLSSELEKVKVAVDRGQISDLVLLERLNRTEELMRETVSSLRSSMERTFSMPDAEVARSVSAEEVATVNGIGGPVVQPQAFGTVRLPVTVGEIGSLPSITTATELQVLTLLATEGPKSAPEIGKAVGRSREHTARLMKKLFEEGYIRRDQTRIPFRYSLVEKVKQTFEKVPVKDEGKGAISVPQT